MFELKKKVATQAIFFKTTGQQLPAKRKRKRNFILTTTYYHSPSKNCILQSFQCTRLWHTVILIPESSNKIFNQKNEKMKTHLQHLKSLKRKTVFNVLKNKFLKILGYSQLIVFLLLSFSISNHTNASISISVSNITSSGCKVSWSAVPGATKYEVTVRYRRCDDIFGCWKNFPSCDKVILNSTSLSVTGINSQPDESSNHWLRRIVDVKAFNQMTEIDSDYKEFYVLVPGPPPD